MNYCDLYRLKRAIDQNKGRVKLAIALSNSHNMWQQKHENKQEKRIREKKEREREKKENTSVKTIIQYKPEEKKDYLDEAQRKMIASFK